MTDTVVSVGNSPDKGTINGSPPVVNYAVWANLFEPVTFQIGVKHALRQSVKRLLWPSPRLFWPLAYAFHRQNFAWSRYDLLLDGFPRSANTYATAAITLSNPDLCVLTHRHMPVYAVRALQQKKAVCILVREPVAAIASAIVFAHWHADYAISAYIAYYRPLLKYIEGILVADFDQTTNDFARLAARLNARFGLGIQPPSDATAFQRRIRQIIMEFPWATDPMRVSLPTAARKPILDRVKLWLGDPRFSDRLGAAKDLYEIFSGSASALLPV